MKIHSEGHRINAGSSLEYKLVVPEDSLIEFDWQTEDDLEVKFSMTFTPEGDSGSETVLIKPENRKNRKGIVEINDAGTCLLLWTNYYTLFQSPVLRYQAHVRRKQDVLAEESKMEKEAEEFTLKRQALDEKIASLHEVVAKMQHDTASQQEICAQREAEVAVLRQRLSEVEENLAADVAHAHELESSVNAKLQEIDILVAERDQNNENGDQNHEPTEHTTPRAHTIEETTPKQLTVEQSTIEQTTPEQSTIEQTTTTQTSVEPTTVEDPANEKIPSDMV